MRSTLAIILAINLMTGASAAMAQSAEDLFGEDGDEASSDESTSAEAAPAPVKDEETPKKKAVSTESEEPAPKKTGRFLSYKGPKTWHERSGWGATLGLGGVTCGRDFCSVNGVKIGGSFTGTLGGYYRMNPNLVFYLDVTAALVNTGISVLVSDVDSDKGFMLEALAGAEFHFPIKGWFDPYIGAGLGFIHFATMTEGVIETRTFYNGIDIGLKLGADIFLVAVGPMKAFSFGPYMKISFPIYPRVCTVEDGVKTCGTPSDMSEEYDEYATFAEGPLPFQLGIQARYGF